ncbi:hypothetical protein ACM9HF_02825 [Colwellia sp. RE-S-Sl-9]
MKKLIALCASLFITLSSQATLLTIELDNTNYQMGDVLQANIVISDIEQDLGFTKLLATFDFDLLFDNSLLAYQTTTFGSLLDVDPLFPSDQIATDSGLGSLKLSELSLAFSSDLFAAQDGLASFVLATVNFDVKANGMNVFNLSNIALSDDLGGSFKSVSFTPTEVLIGDVTSVPEMPSLAIFALGLFALIARIRKA